MASLKFAIVLSLVANMVTALPTTKEAGTCSYKYPFNYKSREAWGARPAKEVTKIATPVSYVVVHHSYIPSDCVTTDQCMVSMRQMQTAHQNVNGWQDIGYNFAVGGEGTVFEGRGWGVVGAHASSYNSKSVGIVMIGDFVSKLPPTKQLKSLKSLISVGVDLGHISKNYKLIGHRQVSATECPGGALFAEISTWDHFTPTL